MKRTKIDTAAHEFPAFVQPYLIDATLYDSSCSREARVYFIDRDEGYYLKRAPKGALEREASLARFVSSIGLGASVLDYRSEGDDWLLSTRVRGEDCTHDDYLSDPVRLAETLGKLLRTLHNRPTAGCPFVHTEHYRACVERNYRAGVFASDIYLAGMTLGRASDEYSFFRSHQHELESNVILHGDYCLPNVILDRWEFSGFIDLGNGGIGDRHVDLFWGAWSLAYNLKTDAYRETFFSAYGRDLIDSDRLRLVAAAECFG